MNAFFPFFSNHGFNDVYRKLKFFPIRGAKAHEAQSCPIFKGGIELVCSQLQGAELIETQVIIDCFDDPVAVQVGLTLGFCPLLKDVAVSSKIKPGATPPFAIMWRGK